MTTIRHTIAIPRRAAISATHTSARVVATTTLRQFCVLVAGLIVLLSAGLMALNTGLVHGAFAVQSLQKQSAQLERAQQTLGDAVAVAEAPGRIAIAASKLGMQPAVRPVFLSVDAKDGTQHGRDGGSNAADVHTVAMPH